LKGPSAILYGRGEPGGVVNIISKKPAMKPNIQLRHCLEVSSGTGWMVRHQDQSSTGILSYRLDASYERSKSYRDVVKSNSYFIKPSFNIKASDNTQILLTGEFSKAEFTPDQGVLMLPYLLPDGSVKQVWRLSQAGHITSESKTIKPNKISRELLLRLNT